MKVLPLQIHGSSSNFPKILQSPAQLRAKVRSTVWVVLGGVRYTDGSGSGTQHSLRLVSRRAQNSFRWEMWVHSLWSDRDVVKEGEYVLVRASKSHIR